MIFEEQILQLRKAFPIPLESSPMDQKKIETLYSIAYDMYERGDYSKASDLFTQLVLRQPYVPRFWKGLASCRQMQKEYKRALHAWASLALLEGTSPHPHYHAAECYLSLGEKVEARKAFQCALTHLKQEDPFYNRAQTFLERIDGSH
ncbi:MAG: Chaperone protein IpgC [Chlamydiae bacterium]|nr:Chaperone protein IpgC [Chlamydiota bacterium]